MALPLAGVRLVAENATTFYRDVDKSSTSLSSFGSAATTTAKAVTAFNEETALIKLDALGNQLADQKTRLAQYGQQLDAITKKEGEGSAKAAAKAAQMESLAGKIAINERRYAALATEINNEAAANTQAAQATESMTTALTHETSATREASTSTTKFTTELIAVGGAATTAEGKVGKFSEIAIGGLRRLGELGVNALGNLVTSIGNFALGSVTAAGDFEASMNKFSAVTGSAITDAGLTLDSFKQKFLDLGAQTQFSSAQAADAANELAKGGVSVTSIMGDATEATLGLASAGELELAPAAEIVAKQLGVWGSTGVTATNVADRLSQAANASTVNVDDLALGLANVGGAARSAGLTFDETVTAIGAISPAFASASTAGTSLNNFLARIQPTTKPAIKAMTDLGLYTKETGSAFYDANGQFVGLEKASALLHDALTPLSEAERSLAVQTIFGNDAKIAALELTRLGAEGVNTFTAAMESQGSATDQAAKKNQGFNFAMESLRGSLETVQIAIGDKVLPVLTKLINDAIIPAVNGFGEFVKGLSPIGDVLTTVGGVLSDIFLPAVIGATTAFVAFKVVAAGGLVQSIANLAVGLISAGGGFVVAAEGAMTAATSFAAVAIPLAAIAVSIGAVVIGIQDYNKKVAAAEEQTLALASGYSKGAEALDAYTTSQENWTDVAPQYRAEAFAQSYAVESLRGQLEQATKAYYEIGGGTEENKQRIVDLNEALKLHSAELATTTSRNNELAQGIATNKQAMLDSMMGVVSASGGWTAYREQVRLTDEQLAELNKTIETINENGVKAFADLQGTYESHTATMAGLQVQYDAATTEEQRQAIQTQMNQQTIANAETERAQRESLGRQLIALAEAEAQKNGVSAQALAEMTTRLQQEYGVQVDTSATTFAAMSGDIQAWAENGGKNSDQVVADLQEATLTAEATQQQMATLAGQYDVFLKTNLQEGKIDADAFNAAMQVVPNEWNVDLIQDFMAGKIDADAFNAAIKAIPTSKTINVHTNYTESGPRPDSKGGATAMYTGGDAFKGQAYLVGDDRGKVTPFSEIIVPKQNSTIFNNRQTRRILSDGALENRPSLSMGSLSDALMEPLTRLGDLLRSPRQTPPPTPQASATRAIGAMAPVAQPTVTKQYILNAQAVQPISNLISTFRTMEAFSL